MDSLLDEIFDEIVGFDSGYFRRRQNLSEHEVLVRLSRLNFSLWILIP